MFPLGLFCTDVQFPQGGGFLTRDKKDKARKIRLPKQSWIQTPSIVNVGSGKKDLSYKPTQPAKVAFRMNTKVKPVVHHCPSHHHRHHHIHSPKVMTANTYNFLTFFLVLGIIRLLDSMRKYFQLKILSNTTQN